MSNEAQRQHIERLKKTICESIEFHEVGKGAISVTTPFIDWDGGPVELFVTPDGRITDGGGTLSLLRSLNMIDDFEAWPFLQDYLTRYCIDFDGRRMNMRDLGNDASYLFYAQGISRLPSYFEPKPIAEATDTFPQTVRNTVVATLRMQYEHNIPKGLEIAEALTQEKNIPLKKRRMKVASDLSPMKKNRIVQVVSYSGASPREQEQHVAYKALAPILWKEENQKVEAFAVVQDISKYTMDSRAILDEAIDEVIQLKGSHGADKLIGILVEP